MSSEKTQKSKKKLSPLGSRIMVFLKTIGMNQSELCKNINISGCYLTELKYSRIKTGGLKFWDGIRKNYPEWEPYLRGETPYPPGSVPLPEVDKKEAKKLYKENVCLFSRNLRFFMIRYHYTQKTLGQRAKCSQSTIHRYLHFMSHEEMKKKARPVYLEAIPAIFEVTLEEMTSIDFEKEGRGIKEPHTPLEPDLISMAKAILSSHTTYSNILAVNIKGLYQAIMMEKNLPVLPSPCAEKKI